MIPKRMPGSFLAALRYDPKCERNTLGYFRASAGKEWFHTPQLATRLYEYFANTAAGIGGETRSLLGENTFVSPCYKKVILWSYPESWRQTPRSSSEPSLHAESRTIFNGI